MRNDGVFPWSAVPVRAWFAALALAVFGLVAVGLELQRQLNLAPCPLCIFQRVLYLVIGALAFLGVLLPAARRTGCLLIGLVAGGGIMVAAYQTWMQAFPQLVTECGYAEPNVIERLVDWLGMQWPSLFLATGFCSSKEWVFLGLSMANWSLLVFIGIVGFAARLSARKNRA